MISKSLNFTLSVTVRPRLAVPSQCRQTLSIRGSSSATIASNSVRSLEKRVFGGRPTSESGWRGTGTFVYAARDPVVLRGPPLPKWTVMNSTVWLRMSMPVKMPRAFIFALVAGPMAVELGDGQGLHERWAHLWRDDVLAVGLSMVGGEFRQGTCCS